MRLGGLDSRCSSAPYIAIEGPIGVGKTTLAGHLADTLGARVLAEKPEDNPFLGNFYDNPRGYALPAQLSFLLQRAHQVDDLRQTDMFEAGCVADFMFDKDPLFAELTLDGAELGLYRQIYARLASQAPTPDCVIYLHAPVEVLMARVAQRDRAAERNLDAAYMAKVAEAYAEFFNSYDATRLIRVDALAFNLADSEAAYARLLKALESGQWRTDLA